MLPELKPSVLVVDDSEMDLEIISIVCDALGCSVDLASDAFEALELFRERKYDLVLTDYMMEPMNGIYLVSQIKELNPDATCLLVTGFPDGAVRRLAEGGQVFDVITKPIQAAELKEILRLALNQSSGATEEVSGIALSNRMDGCAPLSGHSPQVNELRSQVAKCIKSQKALLMTGAQTSGKREIAFFIHENGPHAGKKIVEVTCADKDEPYFREQLISEDGKWGPLLNEAADSTLIMDQILRMPLAVQHDFASHFSAITKRMHLIVLSDDSMEDALDQAIIDDEFYFKVTMEQIKIG